MASSDEIKKRRKVELAECYSVIDTCLSCYYRGEQHMYRPLAGQLRILFCDKPFSLIGKFEGHNTESTKPKQIIVN